MLEINRLPVALDDPSPNLSRRFLQLRLLVGVKDLFHADTAVCAMLTFIAGVQAFVPDALAIAVDGS